MIRPVLLSALLAVASASAVAAEKYDIDQNHTYVTFNYDHFGFSNPTVRLEKVTGDFELDTADLTKSTISVTLPLDGLHTGVPKLDDHIRSPDFFDAAKYPDITFKSTKVEKIGANGLKISGEVTAHGITKPVVLNAKVNKIGENDGNCRPPASRPTPLKRTDFGVGKLVPDIGDEIRVHISLDRTW